MRIPNYVIKAGVKFAMSHKREIATMLRDALDAYLKATPKRKRKSSKKK